MRAEEYPDKGQPIRDFSKGGMVYLRNLSGKITEAVSITWDPKTRKANVTHNGTILRTAIPQAFAGNERVYNNMLTERFVALARDVFSAIDSLPPSSNDKKTLIADTFFRAYEDFIRFDLDFRGPSNLMTLKWLWKSLVELVWEWETDHERIHKGAAYYWLSSYSLLLGDVLSAYPYLSAAAKEDELTYGVHAGDYRMSPANRTIALALSKENEDLRDLVIIPIRNEIKKHLRRYRSVTGKHLSIADVDKKLLQVFSNPLSDVRMHFVATLHEIYHMQTLGSIELMDNDYAKLKSMYSLHALCLVTDQLLEHRFLTGSKKKEMASAILELGIHLKWVSRRSLVGRNKVVAFMKRITPSLRGPLDTSIPLLLNGKIAFNGKPLTPQQTAIFIAHRIRNFGSHNITGQSILVSRHNEVLENVMFAIFVAIETL